MLAVYVELLEYACCCWSLDTLGHIKPQPRSTILLQQRGILRLSNLGLSGRNHSLNLCCSSYSTSFLVTLSVHPSLPFCLSGCHCMTIITYFISLWFHFWWRLARVAFLSLVTFISVRPLLGCGATFFMARMSWAICFPPCSPLRPCHGLVRLSRKNSLWI